MTTQIFDSIIILSFDERKVAKKKIYDEEKHNKNLGYLC